jgi:hypothetical protein
MAQDDGEKQTTATALTQRAQRKNAKGAEGFVVRLGLCPSSDLRTLLGGVEDSKAIEVCWISINDLDGRPRPLPNADAWGAGELD